MDDDSTTPVAPVSLPTDSSNSIGQQLNLLSASDDGDAPNPYSQTTIPQNTNTYDVIFGAGQSVGQAAQSNVAMNAGSGEQYAMQANQQLGQLGTSAGQLANQASQNGQSDNSKKQMLINIAQNGMKNVAQQLHPNLPEQTPVNTQTPKYSPPNPFQPSTINLSSMPAIPAVAISDRTLKTSIQPADTSIKDFLTAYYKVKHGR